MKRLLRIGFDIFINSFTPIITWFLIGIIINKDLANVFTLTYPIQCLMGIIVSIFGVGANVCAFKEQDETIVDNGILYGILASFIFFGLIVVNCENYINYMNMNKEIYLIFCIYSILQILLQTILHLILTKLYYLELNKKANKISLMFNIINFITLIFTALITKNQLIVSVFTLTVLTLFDVVLILKNLKKITFKFNLKHCFKYDSVSCSINIMFFLIYLFGFSNSFAFGEKYIYAITFVTLITDIQWDMTAAIKTVAKIDIVKEKFDYNYHFKNALKFISLLILSVIMMGVIMYPIYNPNIIIVCIFVLLHFIDFIMTPFKNIKICYLEIEYSAYKTTFNTIIAYIIRTIISFLPTPFCTIMGQICSSTYEFIYAKINYKKYQRQCLSTKL